MAAYFIAQYQVNDAALYAEYSAGAGPTLAKYGAELVGWMSPLKRWKARHLARKLSSSSLSPQTRRRLGITLRTIRRSLASVSPQPTATPFYLRA